MKKEYSKHKWFAALDPLKGRNYILEMKIMGCICVVSSVLIFITLLSSVI